MKLLFARFSGYFLTGGLAAITDVGGFTLLLAMGAPELIAAIFSFVVAMVQNYYLTTRFVYAHPLSWRMFVAFVCSAMVGLVVNVSVTMVALAFLDGLAPLAKIAGIGVAFFVNFLMVNFVVFARKDAS